MALDSKKRLDEAKFFYQKALGMTNGQELLYYLSATITSLRSVEWLLKTEITRKHGEDRYKQFASRWESEKKLMFVKNLTDLRNKIQKEVPLNYQESFPIRLTDESMPSGVIKVEVIKEFRPGKKIWYELKDENGNSIPVIENEVQVFLNEEVGDKKIELWSTIENNIFIYEKMFEDAESRFK